MSSSISTNTTKNTNKNTNKNTITKNNELYKYLLLEEYI